VKWGKRAILVLLACGAVVALAAVMRWREKKPIYNGKSLKVWLNT
jgi:hypothetical protein